MGTANGYRAFLKSTMALCFLSVVGTGCASIICGTHQSIPVHSSPPGAAVSVNGEDKGTTPAVLNLKRNHRHCVNVALDGYDPYEVTLRRTINGWTFGNIVFGGIPGFLIDGIDGAFYAIKPSYIVIELTASSPLPVTVDVSYETTRNLVPIPEPTQVSRSTEDRLLELKGLHDRGAISRDEYETKRREIINDI